MKVIWCSSEAEVYRNIAAELSRYLAENEGVPSLILTEGRAASRMLPLLGAPPDTAITFGMLSPQDEDAQLPPERFSEWRRAHPEGFIASVVEIRADGGVMGIAPFPENPDLFRSRFDKERKWVAPRISTLREANGGCLTATFSFLREAVDATIAYAVTQNRGKVLRRLFAEEGFLYETPARILLELEYATLFSLPVLDDSTPHGDLEAPYAV
ncbi:hypothetical protein D6779_11845 [Candidatus Parcubacteria bacterium]|nr:MAG: hypothetical protein D6779_11845 [Candidatus Parcubacteria bacterium]